MKKIRIKIVDTEKKDRVHVLEKKEYRDFLDILKEILERNYEVEISDNPEYVFSILPVGLAKGYEYYQYKDKVQIQIILENARPDFNCFDYAIGGFHNISYANRYLFLPSALMAQDEQRKAYPKALIKHLNINDSLAKRKFCSFVVSNGDNAAPEREMFFHLLSKYKKVDSGGRFLNNIGGFVTDRVDFERQHKFSIAFENAWQSMITEKLDMAFAAQTVPIYWGNTDVKEIYNKEAFIDASDFDCFEDLVNEIIRIDNDDTAYLKMLSTPAYRKPLEEEEYMKRLEAFLVNIIETPQKKAIIRTNIYWSNKLQRMRYQSFKLNYALNWMKINIAHIVKFFGGSLTDSEFAHKIRRYLHKKI